MINLSKKLYISLFSMILLLVVAGTVTFAWFKLNTNAWFDDMQLEVSTADGLKISVDGANFKTTLTQAEIKKAIFAKSQGYELVSDEGVLLYKETTEDNRIIYHSTSNYENDFKRVLLQPVTSNNGYTFKNLVGLKRDLTTFDMINMDIYFKADKEEKLIVYFSNREVLDNELYIPKTTITVENEETIGFPTHLSGNFSTYDKLTGEMISYDVTRNEPIEGFRTLGSDAVRFSVSVTDNKKDPTPYKIYEINKGNGSYATDFDSKYYNGPEGASYDATKNAAFTYYNNVRSYETEEVIEPISFDSMPKTYKGFDTVEGAKIVELNESNNYGANGTVKMNMYVWVEGWDADCIDSVFDQKIIVKMAFTSKVQQNTPITLTYRVTNPETDETEKEWSVQQIEGYPISDNSPVKDVYSSASKSGVPYKFAGWALLDDSNNKTLWDFDTILDPQSQNDLNMTLISVWE